ncbi:iron complex outermembrane receptor protein [Pelomonas saccharophila]|uniref:Iron complex outermembrane receptor protein n=1 Tax=Roseateles saccharophilus TaxID=304 RepID=A0ABU1YL01_ROSSA|nr:TonB-dependent receptor [Roseateles saccharophilus]MDR7268676.1 iron complex outermembrane receptor protein [Roseateles saccharophilus]
MSTLALTPAAHAAPATDASEDQALEALLKREVQGPSRYAQSLMDAPASVSVLERAASEGLGHQTVGDQLARLPGVYLSNSRTYSGLGLRGFNRPGDYSARLLMAIDGQRVNDAIYDQGLPQLELPVVAEWVKRVELVHGPGSSIYGSNALLGVVNIVTLDGADAPGLTAQGSVGGNGFRRAEMHYGAASAGSDLFIGLNLQRTAGEDLFLPELGTADGWVRGLDGERQLALLAKYRNGPWRVALNAVRRDKDAPTAPYGTEAGAAGTHYVDSLVLAELSYDEGWQGDVRKSARLSLAGYEFLGRYVFGSAPELVNKDVARAQWTTLEGRMLWRGLLNHQLMFGAELRTSPDGVQRNYDVEPYALRLDSRVSQDALGIYAQDQWRLSSALQLTTGLRLDHVRGFATALSPRAVLAWRPDERESFKLMWAQSFRTPNLYERFYDDGGVSQLRSDNLKPERLNSVEGAWEYVLSSGHALSANAYYTRMNRLIEQQPVSAEVDAAVQYRNVGKVGLRGVDLGIERRATDGWLWRLSASWMDGRDDAGQRLSNSPSWMFKGDLVTPLWQRWQLGVEWNLLGPRIGRVEVPTTALVNAHLRYHVDPRQSLALHLNNALDRRNLDPSTPDTPLSAIPQPGRAWRLDWRFML